MYSLGRGEGAPGQGLPVLLEALGIFGKGRGEMAPGDIYFLQFLHFCTSSIVHIWNFTFMDYFWPYHVFWGRSF